MSVVLKTFLYILIVIATLFGFYKILVDDQKWVGYISFIFAVLVFGTQLIPGDRDTNSVENVQEIISSDVENGEDKRSNSEDILTFYEETSEQQAKEDGNGVNIQKYSKPDTVLQVSELEMNDTVGEANFIEVNKTYHGNLSTDKDVDYYRFVTQNDGKVSVSFEHPKMDTRDRLWEIFLFDNDRDGKIINLNSTGSSASDVSDAARIRAGEYYIKVNSYYYSNSDYFFTVNFIEETEQYEKEPNDSIDMANPIVVNFKYTGNLQRDTDIDYYRFSVSEKGKVNVSFEHEKIDNRDRFWEVYLLDGVNDHTVLTLYSRGSEASLQSDYARIPPGEYFLKIKSYYYSNKDYIFTLNFEGESEQYESEWNNDFSSANKIVLGSKYYGNIQTDKDIDYYCFTVSEQKRITVSFEHNIIDSSDRYWEIYVIDGLDDKNVLQMNVKGNESTITATAESIQPGNYYVKIKPYYFNNMDYAFCVR